MIKVNWSSLKKFGQCHLHNATRNGCIVGKHQSAKCGIIFSRNFAIEVIKVPRLGDSITEGTLNSWKKEKGEYVTVDETIAVIDTDKVSVDINTKHAGVITNVFSKPGDIVFVDAALCEIDTDGTPGGSTKKEDSSIGTKNNSETSTSTSTSAKGNVETNSRKKEMVSDESKDVLTQQMREKKQNENENERFIKTEEKCNTSENVDASIKFERSENRVKMLPIRKRIAQRLKESQNTCALLTTFNECDMSKVMALRNELKEVFQKKYHCKLGFVSLFLYASSLALKQMPNVNAFIENDEIVYRNYIDISVAVATPTGLTVPVIRNCQNKKLHEIEKALSELAEKARENKLKVEDFTGGTFTISNGGVFGSMLSTPIINLPQSAILGMHTIKKRPVVVNDQIVIRPIMYLALTYDHRLLDGRDAVKFLCLIRDYIENPETMPIE